MTGRRIDLPGGPRVLVSGPSDHEMQAVLSGRLVVHGGYLCLAGGDGAVPLLLPHGSGVRVEAGAVVVTVFGRDHRLGDHLEGGGGTITPSSSLMPTDAGLDGRQAVHALQAPPDVPRVDDAELSPGRGGSRGSRRGRRR